MNLTEHYTWGKHNNLTSVTDAMGRKTVYTYDLEQNLTSVTDASGRTEQFTYDAGSRRTSYTMNGGNSIRYDYDALNDLVEKTYLDENGETEETIGSTVSGENPSGVLYGYDLSGQRVSMMDTSGDSVYTYDGLGRITSVTTYRKPAQAGADTADKEDGETVRYEYDGCDQLAAIIYPDGTRVSYAYDKNDNLTAVTDRNGKTTTYVYDAINRVTEIHRPNGISTYNTYNARDQIVSLKNTCDECGWVVSQYDYTYDDNGYIATEKAVESLYDYAWDDKHNGRHEDGRHDDKMPHGTKHNGKHDKDSEYRFQLVETDREFTYDENGRLLSSKEQEENSGLTTYDYTYDKVGNRLSYVKRTQTTKHPNKTDVAESAFYQYNDSNQLVSAKLFDGKKNTTVDYTYDENGNLISEIGEYGVEQVETYYDYTVENRLQAVYDADRLLMAAAYDGDGNRVFQLNYNLHTDEDWKDNSGNGNGNGNNKDNTGSGNNGNGNSSSGNNGNSGNGNGNNKENSKSEGTDDAGYGNATNAEEHNSQNQSGILFPVAEEISRTETDLIAMIKTTGKEKDYELIEYILNVNTQYTQVLMELNENGAMDAVYTYGVSRLTEDRFTGESNFYLYDPSGNVAGITDQNGYLWQSYRYDAFGNATFGSPQYDNEYTFNAESYNPNIRSQYLRARYYDMVKGNFLTEDSYLGDIREPLTLNRYSYCIGNPLFYSDPSGHLLYHYEVTENVERQIEEDFLKDTKNSRLHEYQRYELYEERINAYEGLNYTGFWDAPWFSKEEQRISYMVGLDYGNSKHRRFIKLAAETAKNMTEAKRCLEEENRITTISEQYVQFLFAYEIGSSDKWAYANDLGDGVVTIAGGVVIKGKGETYPLGEDVYENYMKRKENNDPLSIQEAHKLTIDRMEDFIKGLNDKVKEKGWELTQGRYDAIFDMYWNAGSEIFKYKATELLATGDLTDETVIKALEKEILETAQYTDSNTGVKWWSKNLAERRLDVILIAQEGEGAYERHESLDTAYWNEHGYEFLIGKGIDSEKVHKYKIQQVTNY